MTDRELEQTAEPQEAKVSAASRPGGLFAASKRGAKKPADKKGASEKGAGKKTSSKKSASKKTASKKSPSKEGRGATAARGKKKAGAKGGAKKTTTKKPTAPAKTKKSAAKKSAQKARARTDPQFPPPPPDTPIVITGGSPLDLEARNARWDSHANNGQHEKIHPWQNRQVKRVTITGTAIASRDYRRVDVKWEIVVHYRASDGNTTVTVHTNPTGRNLKTRSDVSFDRYGRRTPEIWRHPDSHKEVWQVIVTQRPRKGETIQDIVPIPNGNCVITVYYED